MSVNIYFFKNNNQLGSWNNIENLSSFDMIFTETFEDLKEFLQNANPILVKLASESKYVPVIRILPNLNGLKGLFYRMTLELPFKEYVKEALPVFKTKTISIEPRQGSENVAVIFESALHSALELVVRNVMYYLKSKWSIIIYHSSENEYFVKNVLKDLPNIEYRLPFTPIYSVSEYNQMMKNYNFYESLKAKKVLIFQTDSLMLKSGIDRFMQNDYIGAPWPRSHEVGNGGFSLRSVPVMMEACLYSRNSTNHLQGEDRVFGYYIRRHHHIAPFEEAYAFSREIPAFELNYTTAEGEIFDGHLAMHKAWNYSEAGPIRNILKHSLSILTQE